MEGKKMTESERRTLEVKQRHSAEWNRKNERVKFVRRRSRRRREGKL